MVKIPKMSWADLGVGTSTDPFPAFVNGSTVKDYIEIGKYQATVQNERAYSLPDRDPTAYIDFDTSFNACAKGGKFHLITRLEWMAVALWCLKNGRQPLGNNNRGKDITENVVTAIPSGTEYVTLNGTGPVTWSHNGLADGIYDMNGNVWEWVSGVRMVYGELQVLSRDGTFDNCAEDTSLSVAADSPYWYAIDGTSGKLITPNGSGTTANSVKLNYVNGQWRWTANEITQSHHSSSFFLTSCDASVSDAAQLVLMALGMIKPPTLTEDNGDWLFADTTKAETFPYSGGDWSQGTRSGIFTTSLDWDGNYSFNTASARLAL